MPRAELHPPSFTSGRVPGGVAERQGALYELGLVEGEVSGLLTKIRMLLRRKSGMSDVAPFCLFLLIFRLVGRSVSLQREVQTLQYQSHPNFG